MIDVTPTISPSSIPLAQKQKTKKRSHHYRHYRHHPNSDKNEVFEVCKWCMFCLAALGSCIVFVSYLLTINENKSSSHHPKFTHHQPSMVNTYLNTHRKAIPLNNNQSNIQRIPIEHRHNNHFDANDLSIVNQKKLNSHYTNSRNSNDRKSEYHLVRSDKYLILDDILFVVFRNNEIQNGREAVQTSWAQKYKGVYDINIKFVETETCNQFEHDEAMCLLWMIDEYMDKYKWMFKIDDGTFVIIENLVDYLSEIELESSLIAHAKDRNYQSTEHRYYWWLSNTQQANSGYLINRDVLDLIVGDIRNYNEIRGEHQEFDKYSMCSQTSIFSADECIAYLLNERYHIHSANTLDMDGNEKFNMFGPMTLLKSSKRIDYISKTPIIFGNVTAKWMDAYYQLFYLHKDANDIDIMREQLGNDQSKIKNINDYAQIVMQYSLTNYIKNIQNEMQHIIIDINYNLVK